METGVVIGLLVGLLVTALVAWFGWKNLEQAKVLSRELPPGMLGNHVGEAVTVCGTPQSLYGGSDPFLCNWLWFHKKYQEYRSGGRNNSGSWRTVREDYPDYGFTLTLEGGKVVTVDDTPTETYGTESHKTGGRGGGGLFGGSGGSRTVTKFYGSKLPMLTVCGKLQPDAGNWRIVRDSKMGLLFSIHAGKDQAKIETIKGWAGVVGGPVVYLAAAAYVMSL